jgi:hypothetical protein
MNNLEFRGFLNGLGKISLVPLVPLAVYLNSCKSQKPGGNGPPFKTVPGPKENPENEDDDKSSSRYIPSEEREFRLGRLKNHTGSNEIITFSSPGPAPEIPPSSQSV